MNNQIVLECAFRYALGRSSYVTDAVSSIIIDCWDALSLSKKIMIVGEIELAIKEKRIGMKMDEDCWRRILLLHEAEKESASTVEEKLK